jgi:ankyrin repeat protein
VRPIHSATAVGDYESVSALLEAGADPNVTQQGGYTPLDAARRNENTQIEQLLLEHGAINR